MHTSHAVLYINFYLLNLASSLYVFLVSDYSLIKRGMQSTEIKRFHLKEKNCKKSE